MRHILCFIVFCISLNTYLFAQESIDVVYLKNGSIIRGEIVEQRPNESIKIKTADGSIFVYKLDEIEEIVKESDEDSPTSKYTNSGFIGTIGTGISFPVIEESFTDMSLAWTLHGSAGSLFNNSVSLQLDPQYNSFEGGDFNITSLMATSI